MKRWLVIVVFSVAVVIGVIAVALPNDEQLMTESSEFEPSFEYVPCPNELVLPRGEDVLCGYLTVLENRNDPDSNTLRLFTAIVRAWSGRAKPDPVVFVTGGPGVPATESIVAYQAWFGDLGYDRDVIFFNQRGTRFSEPYLDCPSFSAASFKAYAGGYSFEEGATYAAEVMLDCHAEYVAQGIDLSTYRSADNAADFEDLRLALGYEQWNLYGISYGTRLSLTIMRDYPNGLRSVILDSVDPPSVHLYEETPRNGAAAFDKFFESCETDADCNEAYPELERVYFEVVERLNENPFEMSVYRVSEGRYYTAVVDGHFLNGNVFYALYFNFTLQRLPWTIYEAYEGNYEPLRTEVLNQQFIWDRIAVGMHYATNCNEEIIFDTLDELESAVAAIRPELQFHAAMDNLIAWKICEGWGAVEPDPIEDEAVVSDVPTLLLAGALDPVTPARWAELAAETLENSYVYTAPNASHSVSTSFPCVQKMMAEFVENPMADPTQMCEHIATRGFNWLIN